MSGRDVVDEASLRAIEPDLAAAGVQLLDPMTLDAIPKTKSLRKDGAREALFYRLRARREFLSGAKTPRISVVIPARNEAKNLPWVLSGLPTNLHEVILVDGNSTDNTIEVALSQYPEIRVIQQQANGKGSALATGLLSATGDVVVMIDADGSMDPVEIHGLIGSLLSGADVVKSSRYIAGGGSGDISVLRNLGNNGLRLVSKVLFGHDWSELAYGMAAFWTDVIPALNLGSIVSGGNPQSKREYGRGFEIETLLFTRAFRHGLRVSEVFSFEYPRRNGVSNLSTFKDGWRVLNCMFRERFTSVADTKDGAPSTVMIVGSGSEFLSGISYYTQHLARAIAESEPVAVILMRKLIPAFLYPGRNRVGVGELGNLVYPDSVSVYNGVDWYGGKTLRKAVTFIKETKPRVVVFQWWTAAVGLSYVKLARAAKDSGAHVVIEFHEVQDVGESKIPLTTFVRNWTLRKLLAVATGVVTHSDQDVRVLAAHYPRIAEIASAVILHGPFDGLLGQYGVDDFVTATELVRGTGARIRLLFFGVIRPYKGLEDLITAYQILIARGVSVSLTIAGEPWGNLSTFFDAVRAGAGGDQVTIIDRYLADDEIPSLLESNDMLVLPYLRSSASGPLALAMAAGMPVVTTQVAALTEATSGYSGAVHVPINSPTELAEGIIHAATLVGIRHENPITWKRVRESYEELFSRSGVPVIRGAHAER